MDAGQEDGTNQMQDDKIGEEREGGLGGIYEVSAYPAPGIRDVGKDRHGGEAAEVISSDRWSPEGQGG